MNTGLSAWKTRTVPAKNCIKDAMHMKVIAPPKFMISLKVSTWRFQKTATPARAMMMPYPILTLITIGSRLI